MPFTFSHPAIILPLLKISPKRISASALIFGSMAPDFEFFLRMRLERIHGHTISGVFYWDLPLTLLLAFIFHHFVRDALINFSPEPIRSNFAQYIDYNWIEWLKKYWFVFTYSALIGIFSHLFWDAWTHESGFFAKRIPWLLQNSQIFIWSMPNYMIGQLVSSIVGAAAIGMVLIYPKKRELSAEQKRNQFYYWAIVSSVLFIVLALRNMQSMGDLLATTLSGGMIGLIVAPRILKAIKRV